MAKRIYFESIKKWLIASGITGGTLIGGLFLFLLSTGAISDFTYSGDSVCAGTLEDPCYAYINFTANEDIFIYPLGYDPWGRDTLFEFEPNVKSWKLQRSWGTGWRDIPLNQSCTGTWCGLSDSKDERVFSYAFRKGRSYAIRMVAMKNNPTESIKWAAFDGQIDPTWEAVTEDYIFDKLDYSKDGKAEFSMMNYEKELPKEAITFSFKEECGSVNSYKILMNTTCTKDVPIMSKIEVCRPPLKNETILEKEVCYDEFFENGTYEKEYQCWEEVKSIPSGLGKYKIEADIKWAICKDGTRGYKIDWIPSLALTDESFTQDKWAWWNASFTKSMKLNFTGTRADNDVTFKVTFNSTTINYSNTRSDGGDIRIMQDDNATAVKFYTYKWNESGDSIIYFNHTGSTSQQSVWVYYGNNTLTNISDCSVFQVFDNFNRADNTTLGDACTGQTWTEYEETAGIEIKNNTLYSMGGKYRDTNVGKVTDAVMTSLSTAEVDVWSNDHSSATSPYMALWTGTYRSTSYVVTAGTWTVAQAVGTGVTYTLSTWEEIAHRQLGTTQFSFYIEEDLISTTTMYSNTATPVVELITYQDTGDITAYDNIRIYDADWTTAYEYGAEQSIGNETPPVPPVITGLCRNLNITGGTETLTNYPVLIHLDNTSNMTRYSLKFKDTVCFETGNTLKHECELFAANNVDCWVKIPSLTTGTNQIAVYYNSTGTTNTEDKVNVWDSNYVAVWHMDSNMTFDSTSNENNVTSIIGTVISGVTGKAGYATEYNGDASGVNGGMMYIPDSSSLDLTGTFCLEAWLEPHEVDFSPGRGLVTKDHTADAEPYVKWTLMMEETDREMVRADTGGRRETYSANSVLAINTWGYEVGCYNLSYLYLYHNGAISGTPLADTGAVGTNNHEVYIGGTGYGGGGNHINGKLDEIRISNSVRTSAWYNYTYQIIENQDTYVTIGVEQSYAPADTCTCAGVDTNWEIDMADHCNITDTCNLGTGTLNFTGVGYVTCNATINTTSMGNLSTGQKINISETCIIYVD